MNHGHNNMVQTGSFRPPSKKSCSNNKKMKIGKPQMLALSQQQVSLFALFPNHRQHHHHQQQDQQHQHHLLDGSSADSTTLSGVYGNLLPQRPDRFALSYYGPTPDGSVSNSIGASCGTSFFQGDRSFGGPQPLVGNHSNAPARFHPVGSSMATLQSILESAAEACADDFVFDDEEDDEDNENGHNDNFFSWCGGLDTGDDKNSHKNNGKELSAFEEDDDLLMPNPVFLGSIGIHSFDNAPSAARMSEVQKRTGEKGASLGLDNDALEHLSLVFSLETKGVNDSSCPDAKRKRVEFSSATQDVVALPAVSCKTEPVEVDDLLQQPLLEVDACSSFDGENRDEIGQEQEETQSSDDITFSENASTTLPNIRGYQKGNWEIKFEELCEFRSRHGHCLASLNDKENIVLARWIKRQRYQYKLLQEKKRSAMTQERVKLLESIGFIWEAQESQWYERLHELKQFKKENGHCNVPTAYSENVALATWVKCQRRQYKSYVKNIPSNINAIRVTELEKIGFQWELRSSNKRQRTE